MAVIKCKMCGGDIELSTDKTYGVCEFCGSKMTFPKVDDEQRAAAFNRGNHFRRIGEFDRALTVYESLVRENELDAEAHWCCALCRFGIEYVKDPGSGEYIPTCHRASFDSFLEDVDTKEAIEHADAVARRQYEHDAQVIEEVRRGILTLSQNEKPYDVFICYKETDDLGQRTIDSQRAQEIYYQLTDQGRRVFFARITLEDKAGQQYEPYIFAALNSAKVMIVVGTKREYLESVWVRNEWSRFLAIAKRDRKKLLIPCYADMDPYDMPEQLSVLQSYDMTKIGFIQDLTRGINKVLDVDKKPAQPIVTQEQTMVSGNVTALLKRGYMALEDGDWDRADDFFEQVLNQDAECADAYLGKALASQEASSLQALVNAHANEHQPKVENIHILFPIGEGHVQRAIEQNVIPLYLSAETIRNCYQYDGPRTYCSTVKYWEDEKQKESAFWSSNRQIVRALKFAKGTYKRDIENAHQELIDFYDKMIAEATTQADTNKRILEQNIGQWVKDTDQKVEELHSKAIDRRENNYENACRAQASLEKQEVILATEYEALAGQFQSIGDYKDCIARQEQCLERSEQIKRRIAAEAEHLRLEGLRRKKKRKQMIALSCLTIVVLIAITSIIILSVRNRILYSSAEKMAASGEYAEAALTFGRISYYSDARERCLSLWPRPKHSICTGYTSTVALKSDGTVVAEGNNNYSQCNVSDWQDVVEVAAGKFHTVGLKSNGTVIATGYKTNGQCKVDNWSNIVAIAAGEDHTVGLKSDGTVFAVGSNANGQCNVSNWKDIVAIAAGADHTVGLKMNGTVVATGDNYFNQCNVSNWKDIIAIATGHNHTVGLKLDGTVVAVGLNHENQCEVTNPNIWSDIVGIAAGEWHTVGLKSNGVVVAVGNNAFGQCEVNRWRNIAELAAGMQHTVGLSTNGTAIAVGSNNLGQCNVSDWTDIRVPETE